MLSETRKQQNRESQQRVREKRLAENRCRWCGKPNSNPDNQICPQCLEKERDKYRASVTEGVCTRCKKVAIPGMTKCVECREVLLESRRKWGEQLKNDVFEAYGGYCCASCGETDERCLQIDHIHNDGAEHRKKVASGHGVYSWLRTHGYPPGYQVLCANCNWIKRLTKTNPHSPLWDWTVETQTGFVKDSCSLPDVDLSDVTDT